MIKNIFKKSNKKNHGYTIIETMIAISLFIIIVMAGMGALLNANLLHNKSQNMRSIIDNLNFIMEDMSRNIRTGYNYHCIVAGDVLPPISPVGIPKSCLNGGWGIAFEHQDGEKFNQNDQWVYYINDGKIFKSTQGASDLSNFFQLTPEEVVIDSTSSFWVTGAESFSAGNTKQPFVTIKLVGSITYNNIITPFSLQTSVSQRLVDI